jgi:F-type H+-transporting ATPase subunit b
MDAILQAFGVNWKLLVIQILNIGILLFLFHRYVYPPLFRIMEERQKKLEEGLRGAEEVKRERREISKEKDEILAGARREGDAIVKDIRSRMSSESADVIREAESRSQKIVADGERLGTRRKEEIVSESREELARVAVKAAEAILRSRKA